MATIRVSNIEAKADAGSPSIDERVTFKRSTGQNAVVIDAKEVGITSVGINTDNPQATLHVVGDIVVGIGTTAPTGSIDIVRTGSNPNIYLTRTDASIPGSFKLEEGNTGAFINQIGSKPIVFQTNNTERARIDSAGRILVGATSGTHELTVVGSTEQRGTTGGGSVVREIGFVTPSDTTSTATITFGPTTSWRAGIVKVSASVTDIDGTDSGFAATYYGVRFVNSAATVITGTANIATSANLVLSTSTANSSMTVTATTTVNNLTIVWDVEVLSRQPNTDIQIAA